MRKTVPIFLAAILLLSIILLAIGRIFSNQNVAPTSYPIDSLFSTEANESFVSSIVRNTDLNSGITMEKSTPLYSSQANNITFAVFNHTDEPIIFANQGFGITVFRYDEINNLWETLKLQYVPYPETVILPPKLEKWDFDIGNSWDILENETTAFGIEQLRLYVSGKGETTNKIYGAYLDVSISLSP